MTDLYARSKVYLNPEKTIWRIVETERNIKTLYIRKDKVSLHKVGKNTESTGSRTGVYSFGKKYTSISPLLKKNMVMGKNRFNSLPQLVIKLPKGEYMTVKFTRVVKRFVGGWERTVGIIKIDVIKQRKKF